MAAKKRPRRGAIATLVSVGLAIPREATRRTAAGIRDTIAGQVGGSIDIVDRIAQRYGLPRAQILKLLNDTLANVNSPGEAVRAVQELALQLPGGAIKRAQGATLTSIGLINSIAGRVGLPGDVLLSTLLAAVGKDWEQLARRQREKIRKAQGVVDRLREEAEQAEEELTEILGEDFPISWHLLAHGANTLRDELHKELHALKKRPTAPLEEAPPQRAAQPPAPSVKPKESAARKPSPKKRAAAKAKAKAKTTTKPKPKPKPKPKSRAKAKAKAKANATKTRGKA